MAFFTTSHRMRNLSFSSLEIIFPITRQVSNCHQTFFFENPLSEVWLHFLQSQAAVFNYYVSLLEGQYVSMVEGSALIASLKQKLVDRCNSGFLPLVVISKLRLWKKMDWYICQILRKVFLPFIQIVLNI